MGLELSIQGRSQAAWPGWMPDRNSSRQKPGEGRGRAFNSAGAESPEEARAYIEQLYKAGRTDELGGLLRRSPVLREAWQTLQQFSPTRSEAAGDPASLMTAAAPIMEQSGLPVPLPDAGPKDRLPGPGQELPPSRVTAPRGFSPETAAWTYPVLGLKPSCSPSAGRRVYETQVGYYDRGRANLPGISLWV